MCCLVLLRGNFLNKSNFLLLMPRTLDESLMNTFRASYRTFQAALNYPQVAQETKLQDIIERNTFSEFGQKHNFHDIDSVRAFQSVVPLTTYDDYEPIITDIGNPDSNILTADEVVCFVPTSGSTSGRKLIPYTETLFDEFEAGIAPWMYDLLLKNPIINKGNWYWSISRWILYSKKEKIVIP